MGDCGALYIGFMISVISLLGFGYNASAFFTLGAPIIVLMVPIMDTLIAILRRKIHHKKFSEADRGHLHHNLMFKLKLGQRKSVLVLYLVTFLFSLSSYLYYYNPTAGTILFIALMIMFEIFVEVTDMISRKYKPILTIVNIFIDSDKLPKIKFLDRYRKRRSPQKAMRDHLIIALCFLLMIVGVGYFMTSKDTPLPIKTETVQSPYTKSGDSELLNNIYARLDTSYKNKDEEDECQLVAAYFVCDYYTFVDKKKNEIGGVDYMYPEMVENFSQYAQTSFYSYKNQYFLGSEMLVCPVTTKIDEDSQKSGEECFIPAGIWTDIFTGDVYNGGKNGKSQILCRNLQSIPVLGRAGAIIPLASECGSNDIINPKKVDVVICPGASNTFVMYEDSGDGFDYEKGEYALTEFVLDWNEDKAKISIDVSGDLSVIPRKRKYRFILRGFARGIRFENADNAKYDIKTNTWTVTCNCDGASELEIFADNEENNLVYNGENVNDKIYDFLLQAQMDNNDKRSIYRLFTSGEDKNVIMSNIMSMKLNDKVTAAIMEYLL